VKRSPAHESVRPERSPANAPHATRAFLAWRDACSSGRSRRGRCSRPPSFGNGTLGRRRESHRRGRSGVLSRRRPRSSPAY